MKKKRIDLTDSQLAIAMWVYIYLRISEYDVKSADYATTITGMKEHFLEEHSRDNLWHGNCLLCERYYRDLPERCACPLSEGGRDCMAGSSYEYVARYHYTAETKARAMTSCKKIIKIMIKEYKKDEADMAKG